MFTEKDLIQFKEKNISLKKIEKQIQNFKDGFPYVKLLAAATPGKGIKVPNQEETAVFTAAFNNKSADYSITKMVPASGAASRMFKDLFTYMESEHDEMSSEVLKFINGIEDFAFYTTLKQVLAEDDYNLEQLIAEGQYKTIIKYMLTGIGLDYASLPKGLLLFHKYEDGSRTSMEEHMAEGMKYSMDKNNKVHLHFTVSPEHKEKFVARAKKAEEKFIQNKDVKFNFSWSEQKASTDTIAVDMNNLPFRNNDGSILFRPGGHGALIENLNDLDTDIAFIKNIDNVVPDKLKQPTFQYKKLIGGLLIELMERSYNVLSQIENGSMDATGVQDAIDFAKNELNIQFPEELSSYSLEEKQSILFEKINRPIRICGMVKNEGEPGGGPFWVESQGISSLQVVESSQIDLNDSHQKEIVDMATHFNPVDLVCSLKSYKGEKFDLREFVDPQTGFISEKSKDGRDLKAQELPGLWNGAMAHWITIFVEVPIETFNPVKTVNDLLRPQHQ